MSVADRNLTSAEDAWLDLDLQRSLCYAAKPNREGERTEGARNAEVVTEMPRPLNSTMKRPVYSAGRNNDNEPKTEQKDKMLTILSIKN